MNIGHKKLHRFSLISFGFLLCIGFASYIGVLPLPFTVANSKVNIVNSFMQLPLYFESNRGQVENSIRYLSRGDGYTFFFKPTEVILSFQPTNAPRTTTSNLHVAFVDANTHPVILGEESLPSKSNYFIGTDKTHWITNVDHFGKVAYQNLYPKVDAIFYGNQRQLEYDFKVAPGGNPNAIRLHIAGTTNIHLDTKGNLVLKLIGDNQLIMHKPVIYQYNKGVKQFVKGNFIISNNNQISFSVGAYNKNKLLIIDPALSYSTYLGGTGGSESGLGIVSDRFGAAYVTGSTNSLDFPTLNPFQPSNLGNQRTAFVTKLNASGGLIYSTYLGGHGGTDQGFAIAVDGRGNAYITGTTNSKDFPLLNPFQAVKQSTNLSAFVTKLNATGNGLVYSTFLGGTGFYNEGLGIAIDLSENAYVTGFTNSMDFPLMNPFQATNNGGNITAFVTKLSAHGNTLGYSTYLGGKGGNDRGFGIAVDCSGSAYVSGQTNSRDFPVLNAVQSSPGSPNGLTGFVTKFGNSGNVLMYSTYLGGSGGNDSCNGITIDSWGNAYVTGFTNAKDFPTLNAYQSFNRGINFSAFITKINPGGNTLIYSTYLGGSGGNDKAFGIAIDLFGNAYVTGQTNSRDFPLMSAIQTANTSLNLTTFVTKLSSVGNALLFSSYLGGSGGNEKGTAISVDSVPTEGITNVYLTGQTNSKDFPVFNPFQASNKGNVTAYVAKIATT